MKFNSKILILLAGIFQLLSLGLDQYAIQKEQTVRELTNKRVFLRDSKEEYSSANTLFYKKYEEMWVDVSEILNTLNNLSYSEKKTSLSKINRELEQHLKLIMSNPNLEIDINKKYLKYFRTIDKLLEDPRGIQFNQKPLIHNFRFTGLILNDLQDYGREQSNSLKDLNTKLESVQKIKFKVLVLGMIANVLSLTFILFLFYSFIIKNRDS